MTNAIKLVDFIKNLKKKALKIIKRGLFLKIGLKFTTKILQQFKFSKALSFYNSKFQFCGFHSE